MSLDDVSHELNNSPDGLVAAAVRSHRVAVEAAAEAAPRVVESLGLESPDGLERVPTPVLLRAVAEQAGDARARAVLSVVASASDEMEVRRADVPRDTARALEQATAHIDGAEDMNDLENRVEAARRRFAEVDGLNTGLEVAQAILADGATTTYNTTAGPLATNLQRAEPGRPRPDRIRRKILRIAKADVAGTAGGAAAGAVGGAVIGAGVGAAPGAAAGALTGAVGGSVTAVFKAVLDRAIPDA